MGKDESDLSQQNFTSWVETKLWLPLLVYAGIYGVVGWSVAGSSDDFIEVVSGFMARWNLAMEDELLVIIIRVLSLVMVIGLSLAVLNPLSIVTFVFEESINSDLKSFIAILIWSILLVFAFCNFDYFANLLVIASATILLHLDLQERNIKPEKVILLMVILASIAFSLGSFLFDYLH